MAAGIAAENLRVGPTAAAQGDDGRRLVVGDASADELQESGLAHSGIFEIRERSAGEDSQPRGPAMRFFENDLVGEASEAHGQRFARPQADLIELRQLHHGGFGYAGAQQLGDIVAGLKLFFAAASQTENREAIVIGKTSLLDFRDLRGFVVADVHVSERLNRGETQAGIVERGHVQRGDAVASENEKRSGEKDKDGRAMRRRMTQRTPEKDCVKHANKIVDAGAAVAVRLCRK